jgi:sensor histidine kinase regulating citrate/malate metabolism
MREKFPRISLGLRIAFLITGVIALSVILQVFAARTFINRYIVGSGSDKVMSIAKEFAVDLDVINAFSTDEPQYIIHLSLSAFVSLPKPALLLFLIWTVCAIPTPRRRGLANVS